MANDLIYKGISKSAFLAHYRTKGSKNGVSTTKGYQAVGRRARGRLSADGRYVYDTSTGRKYTVPSGPGMGSYHSYELNEDSAKKSGVNMKMARNAINSMNKGADNNWQQRANHAHLRDMRDDAYKSSPNLSGNNWQQRAESERNRTIANIKEAAEDARKEAANFKRYENDQIEQRKAQGPTNLEEGTRNKIRKQYADEVERQNLQDKAASRSAKGAKNNWQQSGNKERARLDYLNLLANDEISQKKASAKKMASPQKSAMGNDPRYGDTVRVVNYNASQNAKNVPYYNQMVRATNKQEFAAAKAKSKQALNDFAESYKRNKRSDIGNAIVDAKEDAKKKWKDIKKSAKKTASKIGKKSKSLVEKFKNLF